MNMSDECEKCGEEMLREIINKTVEDFVFPDGCLDLERDEQNAFIGTLVERIKERFNLWSLNATNANS